ncbi:HTH-type transcriptional regulator/antitoxin HigA [Algoriphagus sp. 4150]|uniref:transcriptional regulator n=1 Tax=Algoriphagus sp. 4150 TaxID=2817756 RepID=UPI002861166F|nr:transcriptional regulator [Algoriphagus sp. 4150]MDR7130267.1 HTH-type transcriptional regulator/antitoxin HigA [Algoriphagus sp. 4150]
MKWNNVLNNDQEYEAALKKLSPIFDADPESPEGKEAEQLVNLITAYEKIHYPIPEIEVKNNTSKNSI